MAKLPPKPTGREAQAISRHNRLMHDPPYKLAKGGHVKGHAFPKDFGFSGSCAGDGGPRSYVSGYFRGGSTKKR